MVYSVVATNPQTFSSGMQLGPKRRPVDGRSILTVGLVLLLGASLGFVVGYKYKKPKAKATSAASAKAAANPAYNARTTALLISCMATKGVKYPSTAANISQPPAGVAHSAYEAALTACRSSVAVKNSNG